MGTHNRTHDGVCENAAGRSVKRFFALLPVILADSPGALKLPVMTAAAAFATSSPSVSVRVVATSVVAANDTTPVLTPGPGSKTRTAILDALRERLKMKGRFRVDHIRTYKSWAFVRATEVVELDKGELQETDLTVSALLERSANSKQGVWRIVELWTLPDDEKHSMADFLRNIRAKQRAERLPAALFPEDLR